MSRSRFAVYIGECACLFAVVATTFLLLVAPASAHASDICPGGHLATPEEAAAAKSGAIIAGKTVVCPKDANFGVSNAVGSAKQYLKNLPKKCIGACAAPPDDAHIEQLNNAFAFCAANFLKAYTDTVGGVYITSAYRDGPSGENARAGGAPGSNHTRGMAMDVYPSNGDYRSMWSFANRNPQFGICFPHQGQGSGFVDRPHMILAGIGGTEGTKCAALGIVSRCAGSPDPGTILPPDTDTIDPPNHSGYGNPFTNPLTGGLQPPPPPPPSPVSSQLSFTNPSNVPTSASAPTSSSVPSLTTGTTNTCIPSYSCEGGTVYYKTSSCTTQVYKKCENGCDGNQCKAASSTSSTLDRNAGSGSGSTETGTSVESASSTDGSGTAGEENDTKDEEDIGALIEAYARGQGGVSVETGTSVPVTLNEVLGGTTGIVSGGGSGSSGSTSQVVLGPVVTSGQIQSDQTFSANTDNGNFFTSQSETGLVGAVKNVYRGVINWLQSVVSYLRR